VPTLGDTLTFSTRLYDQNPANPGASLVNATTVALSITLPDTSTLSPSVGNPPDVTGLYHYELPTVLPGRYVGRWFLTLASGNTASYVETFDVAPADPGYLISLTDAKKHLNITTDDNDSEIMGWVAAITRLVENRVGTCIPTTYTENHFDVGRRLILDHTPVLSVVSVVPYGRPYGISYVPGQLAVDENGYLDRLDGLPFYPGAYRVTYRAGRPVIPANITAAVKIILQHLWQTQRGSASPAYLGGDDTTVVPGFGFAVPNRALELLEADDLGPGVG
jgi:hypothetical protein